MTDCIDPAMDGKQRRAPDSTVDGGPGEAQVQQLSPRDHAVLPLREVRDRTLDSPRAVRRSGDAPYVACNKDVNVRPSVIPPGSPTSKRGWRDKGHETAAQAYVNEAPARRYRLWL